jgi:hypothetical protein
MSSTRLRVKLAVSLDSAIGALYLRDLCALCVVLYGEEKLCSMMIDRKYMWMEVVVVYLKRQSQRLTEGGEAVLPST